MTNVEMFFALSGVIVAFIGGQTVWILYSLKNVHTRIDRLADEVKDMRGDIQSVRGEMNDMRVELGSRIDASNVRIDNLGKDLHNHEIACGRRNTEVEIRLDRLEKKE